MAVKLRLPALLAVAVLAAVVSATQGLAASGPARPGLITDCVSTLGNMSDCLTYVQNGSTAQQPDGACCPLLAGLVEYSKPVCLCQLLARGAGSFGITIDYTRALALPGVCHVTTTPVCFS